MPYYNEDAHEGPLMDHISFLFILMLFLIYLQFSHVVSSVEVLQ